VVPEHGAARRGARGARRGAAPRAGAHRFAVGESASAIARARACTGDGRDWRWKVERAARRGARDSNQRAGKKKGPLLPPASPALDTLYARITGTVLR